MASTSHYAYSPLPLPASANPEYFAEFGRRVEGFDASQISHEQMTEIIERLYKVGAEYHGSSLLTIYILHSVALYTTVQRVAAHSEAAIRIDTC